APYLVAATGGRVLGAGGETQRRIHHRVHARQLAEALGHEAAAAVVQERRIRVPGRARDHGVALVAAAADGVEDVVLHAQRARHQVQVAAGALRLRQLAEAARVQHAARQHRFVVARTRPRRAVPGAHRLGEVAVADLGAVDALLPGGDGGSVHAWDG